MSILDRIASRLGRQDEIPNQDLARDLAFRRDRDGIRAIAAALREADPAVQSDCIKVLYEIGAIQPGLIAEYSGDFLRLLQSPHNRLVWGGMLALSTLADIQADELFLHAVEIQRAVLSGSVITVDAGVKTLALIAAQRKSYAKELFPFLLDHLAHCRPKDVAQHAEKTCVAVNDVNRTQFLSVLENRMPDLTPAQAGRVRKVMRAAGGQ